MINNSYKHFIFALLLLLTTNIIAMNPPLKYFGNRDAMQKAREARYLCDATKKNNQLLLKDFINLRYDVNSQMTITEYTALHEATEQGHIEIANILLQNGANLYIKECRGLTPLDLARKNQNVQLINLFGDHLGYYVRTPEKGIDKTKDKLAKQSHSALLYARLATLEKELANII